MVASIIEYRNRRLEECLDMSVYNVVDTIFAFLSVYYHAWPLLLVGFGIIAVLFIQLWKLEKEIE